MTRQQSEGAFTTKQLGRYNDTFKSKVFDHADYEPLTSKQSAAGKSVREHGTSIEDFGRRTLPKEKPREKIQPVARPSYETPEKSYRSQPTSLHRPQTALPAQARTQKVSRA